MGEPWVLLVLKAVEMGQATAQRQCHLRHTLQQAQQVRIVHGMPHRPFYVLPAA